LRNGPGTVPSGGGEARHIVHEVSPQESFVGAVLEEAADEIRHSREELPDRGIVPNGVSHLPQRAFRRLGHPIEHLELEGLTGDASFLRSDQHRGDRPDVVGAGGKSHVLRVLQNRLGATLEVPIGVRFPVKYGNRPPFLSRHDVFVFPVGPFHEADSDPSPPVPGPFDDPVDIPPRILQIRLESNPGTVPSPELLLVEKASEYVERDVLPSVHLHVHVHEPLRLPHPAEDGAEPLFHPADAVLVMIRPDPRGKGGDLDGYVHRGEAALPRGVSGISPCQLRRQAVGQGQVEGQILIRLAFGDGGLAQNVDGYGSPLLPDPAQIPHGVFQVLAGDEVLRESEDVPVEQGRGQSGGKNRYGTGKNPFHNGRQGCALVQEILPDVLRHEIAGGESGKYIHEPEEPDLPVGVLHGRFHDPARQAFPVEYGGTLSPHPLEDFHPLLHDGIACGSGSHGERLPSLFQCIAFPPRAPREGRRAGAACAKKRQNNGGIAIKAFYN
jgi:hypothetical protein